MKSLTVLKVSYCSCSVWFEKWLKHEWEMALKFYDHLKVFGATTKMPIIFLDFFCCTGCCSICCSQSLRGLSYSFSHKLPSYLCPCLEKAFPVQKKKFKSKQTQKSVKKNFKNDLKWNIAVGWQNRQPLEGNISWFFCCIFWGWFRRLVKQIFLCL